MSPDTQALPPKRPRFGPPRTKCPHGFEAVDRWTGCGCWTEKGVLTPVGELRVARLKAEQDTLDAAAASRPRAKPAAPDALRHQPTPTKRVTSGAQRHPGRGRGRPRSPDSQPRFARHNATRAAVRAGASVKLKQRWRRSDGAVVVITDERIDPNDGLREVEATPEGLGRAGWSWDAGLFCRMERV